MIPKIRAGPSQADKAAWAHVSDARRTMGALISLVAVIVGCSALPGALSSAAAQQPHPMPSASEYSAKLLPDRKDVVPWKSLSNVRLVKGGDGFALSVGEEILALDQKNLRVQGFM